MSTSLFPFNVSPNCNLLLQNKVGFPEPAYKLKLLFDLSAVSCVTGDVIPVFGYEGSDAEVPCPYPAGYEDYEKYLCKNDYIRIRSEGENNKYSIYDDQEALTFTVTISDLRFDDVGKYWCGVTRTGKDIYTEVKDAGTYWCRSNSEWSVGSYTKVHLSVGKSKTQYK
uniref:Immunoglobulin V-set domain-containing protein n=1 Tax=Poecilia reticulata TaxID=8081 RepID=A0A3P9MT07_POERE